MRAIDIQWENKIFDKMRHQYMLAIDIDLHYDIDRALTDYCGFSSLRVYPSDMENIFFNENSFLEIEL